MELEEVIKDMISLFVRITFKRTNDTDVVKLIKKIRQYLEDLLVCVGITTVGMITSPSYNLEELKKRFQESVTLYRPPEVTPIVLDAFAYFIAEKRVQSNLEYSIGSTYNVVTQTRGPVLIKDYFAFLEQRQIDKSSPRRSMTSHASRKSVGKNAEFQLNIGLEALGTSVGGKWEKKTAINSSNSKSSLVELSLCRWVDIKKLPQPIAMERCNSKFVRHIGMIILHKAIGNDNGAELAARALFDDFGTHFCQENMYGASTVKTSRTVAYGDSKSKTYGGDLKAPIGPVKLGGGATHGNNNTNETVDETEELIGKLDDRGCIVSEGLVAASYAPIWELFENDETSERIETPKQAKLRKALREFIKEQWEQYTVQHPEGYFLSKFGGFRTDGDPNLDGYVTIGTHHVRFDYELDERNSFLLKEFDDNGNFSLKRRIGDSSSFLYLCWKPKTCCDRYGIGIEFGPTESTKLSYDDNTRYIRFVSILEPHFLALSKCSHLEYSKNPCKWHFNPVPVDPSQQQQSA